MIVDRWGTSLRRSMVYELSQRYIIIRTPLTGCLTVGLGNIYCGMRAAKIYQELPGNSVLLLNHTVSFCTLSS